MSKSKQPPEIGEMLHAWQRVQAAAGTSKVEGANNWDERAELEKQAVLYGQGGDGRSRRATGRTKQLNVKVKPAFDAELRALAKSHKVGIAEMLERIFAEWKGGHRA